MVTTPETIALPCITAADFKDQLLEALEHDLMLVARDVDERLRAAGILITDVDIDVLDKTIVIETSVPGYLHNAQSGNVRLFERALKGMAGEVYISDAQTERTKLDWGTGEGEERMRSRVEGYGLMTIMTRHTVLMRDGCYVQEADKGPVIRGRK